MDLFSLIIVLIFIVVVLAYSASEFERIANMKGHKGYFWWCFLLGAVGWAMVIALPDRGASLSCDPWSAGQLAQKSDDDLPEL